MSQETEIVERELFPEGDRVLKVLKVEEKTSKAGNAMLEWTVEDDETGKCDVICTIMTQGKRWALKNILSSCKVTVLDGEVYVFKVEELTDKVIIGRNKHLDDTFINRKGETVEKKKNKFTTFFPYINIRKEGEVDETEIAF